MIQLTENEACLLVDLLNGTIVEPSLAEQLLPMECRDGIALDHLDQKWNVDGPALVAKLESLDNAAANQIVERVKKFWDEYHVSDVRQRVRAIGLANAAPEGDTFLTATAAAKLCGMSVAALGQRAAKGKLKTYPDPAVLNPRHATRYLKSEIVALRTKSRVGKVKTKKSKRPPRA